MRVTARHSAWESFRDELAAAGGFGVRRVYHRVDHPDLAGVASARTHVRPNLIAHVLLKVVG